MKLKRIALSIVAGAALMVPTALTGQSQNSRIVQASTLKNKITFVKSYSQPMLYNKNGKSIANKNNINFNKPIRFYGQPTIIQGPKVNAFINLNGMPQSIVKGKTYADLGDGGYVTMKAVGSYNWNSNEIGLIKNAYVYNSKGQRLSTYRGRKAYLTKGSKIKYAGKSWTTYPDSYFNLGGGNYLKSNNVNTMNGKGVLKLNTNTAVYNKKGRRISFNGQRVFPKYSIVNYAGKRRTKTKADDYYYTNLTGSKSYAVKNHKIKGQDYYYIGKGAYIKAINVGRINGNPVFRDGGATTIIPQTDLFIYNSNLKKTKKSVKKGQKIRAVDPVVLGSGDIAQLFFRIKGTSNYVSWGDYSEYGFEDDEHVGYFNFRVRLDPVKTIENAETRAAEESD
ncbi:SLAP domain-containing protein [Lactobacillus kefiranofaciens]|uniref:SLAP domain-containing protein n=1 Tax=Lactobacillus kefiranofaciens TaxID=267818 RepID=UPI0024689645|nr:SLAP domain-containing protein [Lactobacillus kefiranofaciens]MDH5101252.1 SLAP domain-containing protein [Lactobacillus kefiranofaciens]